MPIILKNFTKLNQKEKELVYNSRNDERVRKYCHNKDLISFEEHIKFINNLKLFKDKLFFLVYVYEIPIGVISFTNIQTDRCYIGSYKIKNDIKLSSTYLEYSQFFYIFEVLKKQYAISEILTSNKKVLQYQLEHKMAHKILDMGNFYSIWYSIDLYLELKYMFKSDIIDIFGEKAEFEIIIL